MSDEMITVSSPERALSRELLHTPGGFAWWYLDMVNEEGDGLVAIWSFGLPFLPGLAGAARRGAPQVPASRPSFNLALYRGGEQVWYALREYEADEAWWSKEGDRWGFGANRFMSRRVGGRQELEISVDLDVPGSRDRLLGEILVGGAARQESAGDVMGDSAHDWTPLMGPATGRAELRCGRERYAFDARAYHDRNGGERPLHDLGFSHWHWGRLAFPDREVVYYVLWPEGGGDPLCLGLEIGEDGETRRVDGLTARVSAPTRGKFGLAHTQRIELFEGEERWLEATWRTLIDDGFFYLRGHVDGTQRGEVAVGVAEYVEPGRVDRRRHRPLVQMAVKKPTPEQDSIWLPLFTGPKSGRVERLAAHMVARAAKRMRR
jgi:hypothetical protein